MKIEVLSHYLFDEKMKGMNLNDGNVDTMNMGFISIIGTKECLKYYLDEEKTKHYFNNEHENVLNLDFDDITVDALYNGHLFKAMTMEQAETSIDFIEKMLDKGVDEIKIHCRAGYSRSRAVAEFIYRLCEERGIDVEYLDRNDYTTMLNQGVLRRLNHAYWKKHKLNNYAIDGEDYPQDLTSCTPRIIDRD
jgi:protein-tyrosine phosphatase